MRRNFESARQLTRVHQYMLVFCKGDPREAAKRVGPIQFIDMHQEE